MLVEANNMYVNKLKLLSVYIQGRDILLGNLEETIRLCPTQ